MNAHDLTGHDSLLEPAECKVRGDRHLDRVLEQVARDRLLVDLVGHHVWLVDTQGREAAGGSAISARFLRPRAVDLVFLRTNREPADESLSAHQR